MATLIECHIHPGWWNIDLAVRFLLKDAGLTSEHYEIIYSNGSVVVFYKRTNPVEIWDALQNWIEKHKLK